jgi:hypothetical protein
VTCKISFSKLVRYFQNNPYIRMCSGVLKYSSYPIYIYFDDVQKSVLISFCSTNISSVKSTHSYLEMEKMYYSKSKWITLCIRKMESPPTIEISYKNPSTLSSCDNFLTSKLFREKCLEFFFTIMSFFFFFFFFFYIFI